MIALVSKHLAITRRAAIYNNKDKQVCELSSYNKDDTDEVLHILGWRRREKWQEEDYEFTARIRKIENER
jgi:hypothetical protein